MKRIAIIGSGDLGQQITSHIHHDTDDKVVAYFDHFRSKGTLVNDIPVIGGNDDIIIQYNSDRFDAILIAIGYNHMNVRKYLFEELKDHIPFYTFVHSSVLLDTSAVIGRGSVVFPRCLIDQRVLVGENVLLNVSVTVCHDSNIGSHSFIAPAVAVAGFVKIGDQCNIGVNSTIIDNIVIAGQTQIGGGTVIITNIEQAGLYVGNPARFIR